MGHNFDNHPYRDNRKENGSYHDELYRGYVGHILGEWKMETTVLFRVI